MEKWYVASFGKDDEGGFMYCNEVSIENLFGYIPNKGDTTTETVMYADIVEKNRYCVEHICDSEEEAKTYINLMCD